MKLLGDIFRNLFIVDSYVSVFMFGATGLGDPKSLHAACVYSTWTAVSGILWFLARLLYRRGHRLAIVWTKEAA